MPIIRFQSRQWTDPPAASCRCYIHPPVRRRYQIPIAPAATSVPNFPRLRALALFGRRPPQRVEEFVMPASKNLHRSGLSPLERLEASHSSCRIPRKTWKRQPPYGLGRGNLAVTREDLIKHLFEVDSIAMSLDELRSNNWHHISQHVAAKQMKSPNLLSLAEVEIDRGAALPPIAQRSAVVSVDRKGRQFRCDV